MNFVCAWVLVCVRARACSHARTYVCVIVCLCVCVCVRLCVCVCLCVCVDQPVRLYWLNGCLTSQPHACVSRGWICLYNSACRNIETEVSDPTCYPTQSQCTDTGPASPSSAPVMPGAWQGGVPLSAALVGGVLLLAHGFSRPILLHISMAS